MDPAVYAEYPPPLSPEQQGYLVSTVKDWAIRHGLAVRPSPAFVQPETDPNRVLATNAPITLFPSPFPRQCFETAVGVQTAYNELYAQISRDEEWLGKVIKELVEVDDFIANLWKVHLAVKSEGYVQPLSLGLFRSDYMVHAPSETAPISLKQVEFNTISSSFGGLSCLVSALHSELLTSPTHPYPPHQTLNDTQPPPENTAVATLATGLAAAHQAYGPSKSTSFPQLPLCIIFLIQDGERNIFDQHELSARLVEFHKIPVFRLKTAEILKRTSIPASNPLRPLIYTPPHSPFTSFEVTAVYLRSFYDPSDYPTQEAWTARTHIERSAAIKCPSVLTQLAGCKKVQQILAQPDNDNDDHLSSFLPHTPSTIKDQIRSTFAPQYDLANSGKGRELALDPSTAAFHVLKPQREGGGNNVYRTAIPGFLRSIPERDWKGWILMELIQPPREARNVALRSNGEVLHGNVVGELGIFGTILWRNDGEILHNEQGGWLMRTKAKDNDEGGVAAGFSSLDSIILV